MISALSTTYDILRLFFNRRILSRRDLLTVSMWHEFHKPPYGGGNQFFLALKKAFEDRGLLVVNNVLSPLVDVHLCNSAWFDVERFERLSRKFPIKMIHRIDGPVGLYRGDGMEEDEKIHRLNKQFAAATVYQSRYCLEKSRELGLEAVRPVIISNSVNEDIFHKQGRITYTVSRKIRLISAAWSDNPLKGGPLFKWLDEHLDWNRFEYTFVGRVQQTFKNIRHIPPQNSENLASILRDHDVFISASRHEPCSNALLEALSCGLPALYRNEGGNSELVGEGGIAFDGENDILEKIDRLVGNYEIYRQAVKANTMEEIAGQYIALIKDIVA
ncbi:MAG: glycosyltransferase family 4 protein [Candidatus Electrothrix aestuarii]|uniref:Glycosyltransferase family 4 protein n=1 Tax=Candidatus Electrothrix aestuarii TaxID=3062594 RepID=A0AAU8LWU9_9BACT|nr:glycosyltransferase family 4 protein [Candidatus Electrothrix aestuarii]